MFVTFRQIIDLNLAFNIAKRLIKDKDKGQGKISGPVIKISILSIILGMIVMIIAISVVTGFQHEIRNKVIGFGSHIQINAFSDGQPINIRNAPFYPSIQDHELIEHIQMYAIKPGIIQNYGDTLKTEDGKVKIDRDVEGIMCKGIGPDFDWDFIESKLVAGEIVDVSTKEVNKDLVLSQYVANLLKLSVGDKIDLYFLKGETPLPKSFKVKGIYNTGFEEYDKELVYLDIRHIQKLNNWGSSATLSIKDTCKNGRLFLEAYCYGGIYEQNYRFNLGRGYDITTSRDPHRYDFPLFIKNDTTITLTAAEFKLRAHGSMEGPEPYFLPDTAVLSIDVEYLNDSIDYCLCENNNVDVIKSEVSDGGYTKKYFLPNAILTTTLSTSGGTYEYYVGGFELSTSDWEHLESAKELVEDETNAIGNSTYNVQSIMDVRGDIFGWLDMLDMNVIIILALTIFVAVINMSSALLVLILERTNMIGILKAMGSSNWTIRKVFLYNAAYLIGQGMIWGNIIGIGLCLLQQEFQLVSLPTETYYISSVPVNLNIWHILLLNAGTIVLCTLAMIIPSYFITRISPVKAIKFN